MKKTDKPCAFLIFGPTAVGKTDFVLEIAKQIPSEIINGDIGQFYTPLTIGTAKPDWKNEPVPHHLFDVIDEPRYFSVWEYRKLLLDVVHDIWSRGKLPIIVGGSGFYLKSIFFPPLGGDQESLSEQQENENRENLWEQLCQIDSDRAAQIHKDDTYRIQRALQIWRKTGKKPSELVPEYDPPFHFSLFYLTRKTDELYDRINQRTGVMVKEGWMQEVEKLRGTEWEPFLYKKKLIGYDVLLDYLKGERTEKHLDQAIEIIQQRTRNYAKRQKSFWKSFSSQLDEVIASQKNGIVDGESLDSTQLINLTLLDRDLYISQVLKRLMAYRRQV